MVENVTTKHLYDLVGMTLNINLNRFKTLFELENITFSYNISFYDDIDCCIKFIHVNKSTNYNDVIYMYKFIIYIEDEMCKNFSSFIWCCYKVLNFDEYKYSIKEYYKYNIYLEAIKMFSSLFKDGEIYKSMNVYVNSIELKNKLDKVKVELDKMFINKITDLCNFGYYE